MESKPWSDAALQGVKNSQALAYQCVLAVKDQLVAGMTEKDVAQLMRSFLGSRGVDRYFHGPFVWFGERTLLSPHWSDTEFLPTSIGLKDGMAVILDVAPIFEGYASDIGYTTSFGTNPLVDRLCQELADLRDLIPRRLNQGDTMEQIYQEIDRWIEQKGYVACHHRYPAGVIGHLVDYTHPSDQNGRRSLSWDDRAMAQGFGESAVDFLLEKKALSKQFPTMSPYWNGRKVSDHRPTVGVWAVEPHFGARWGDNVAGVKFEELLVVTPETSYWLDDNVPHVMRWRQPLVSNPSFLEVSQCR